MPCTAPWSSGPPVCSPPRVSFGPPLCAGASPASCAPPSRSRPSLLTPVIPLAAVYYMFKARQLQLQIQAASAAGPHAWRQTSVTAGRPSELLLERGCAPMRILVPHPSTGVDSKDHVEYARTVQVTRSKARQAGCQLAEAPAAIAAHHGRCQATAPPAPCSQSGAFCHESSLPLPSRLATPPMWHDQRAKRSRVSPPARAQRELVLEAPRPGLTGRTASAALPVPAPYQSLAPPLYTAASSHLTAAAQRPRHAMDSDPHGVMAWLAKVKSMLSPASRQQPAVYMY